MIDKLPSSPGCRNFVDPRDPAFLIDPYPGWARLRAADPVHFSVPLDAWILTRFDDVTAVLADPRTFAATRPLGEMRPAEAALLSRFTDLSSAWLFFRDGPDHRSVRGLLDPACTPAAARALEDEIARATEELVAAAGPRADGVADLARPLAARVVGRWLAGPDSGLRTPDSGLQVAACCVAIAAANASDDSGVRARGVSALEELARMFEALVKRPEEAQGLAGELARAAAARGLPAREAAAQALSVACAGHETVQDALASALHLIDSAGWERVRTEPDGSGAVVDEVLRLESPVHAVFRTATHLTELRGKRIRAGERLLLAIGAANRDPARFPDPDRFDADRAAGRLAFGHGPHVCPGAPLARLELSIALSVLARCDVRPAGPVRWRAKNLLTRGLAALPLEVRYASRGGESACRFTATSTRTQPAGSARSSSGSSRSRPIG